MPLALADEPVSLCPMPDTAAGFFSQAAGQALAAARKNQMSCSACPGTSGSGARFPHSQISLEDANMNKLLISGAVAAFAVGIVSASAQPATGFYIVRDATTKKCTIV